MTQAAFFARVAELLHHAEGVDVAVGARDATVDHLEDRAAVHVHGLPGGGAPLDVAVVRAAVEDHALTRVQILLTLDAAGTPGTVDGHVNARV